MVPVRGLEAWHANQIEGIFIEIVKETDGPLSGALAAPGFEFGDSEAISPHWGEANLSCLGVKRS